MQNLTANRRVAVIGGGPAGMMAAGIAAQNGADVTLYERNPYLGKKLNITGKGRCNLTNQCEINDLVQNIPRNPRFLYGGFSRFAPRDVMNFFESLGVPLKIERGRRVFPVSDRARDITDALEKFLKKSRVKIVREKRVQKIIVEHGEVQGLEWEDFKTSCQAVVLATGGISYPVTGSTGDGYRMAQEVGHTVTQLDGSLVPLDAELSVCRQLQGLTLKNVVVSLVDSNSYKTVFQELGEMLFTHFGVSGPLILSASAHMCENKSYYINIDLKPGLDEKKLENRILRDFEERKNQNLENGLRGLLPGHLPLVILHKAGIDANKKVNSVSKEERTKLRSIIKALPVQILGKRPVEEAIVTSGGICLKEVNPKTMESKVVKGLYFAGEILDVDAYTGGYNLQIAWSTGYVAGMSSACGK